MQWFDWHHVIEFFEAYASPLAHCAVRVLLVPYEVTGVEMDTATITIDPSLTPRAAEAFALTKALIAHEASHLRYSENDIEWDSPLHKDITNILEDVRIEDAISSEYPGLFPGFTYLQDFIMRQVPALEGDDSAKELRAAMLHISAGSNIKGVLGPTNQERMKKILPLMFKAWRANHTAAVAKIARKIIELFPPYTQDPLSGVSPSPIPMGDMAGKRHNSPDIPSFTVPLRGQEVGDIETGNEEDPPSKEEEIPGWQEESNGQLGGLMAGMAACHRYLGPQPYRELMESCRLDSHRLSRFLQRLPPRLEDDKPARRGRLSIREYLRNPEKPFLKTHAPGKRPRLSLGILFDISGSMDRREVYLRQAAMTIYLACKELKADFAMWVFSSFSEPYLTIKAFDDTGLMAPALIAGLKTRGGTKMFDALQALIPVMRTRRADQRVLIVVHDGETENPMGCQQEIYKVHRCGDMEIIGIFLTDNLTEATNDMAEIFGNRFRVIKAGQLPAALSGYLIQLMQIGE